MTDKLRELLEDVRTVYEGKGMVVYPNSFSRLSDEIMRLDNINRLQKEQIEKMKCCENCGWYYLQQHWSESEEINESRMFHCGTCGNKRNWKSKEIKENDRVQRI